MDIRLCDYKEGVVASVQTDYDPKRLDLEFVDLKYTSSLHLEGTVEKGHDTLIFRGHLTSAADRICGRCLKSVPHRLDKPYEFFYEIQNKEVIETLEDLREVMILDYPISFLCREDCRGLCPHCGTNLNLSGCHCQEGKTTGSFKDLEKIWKVRHKEKKHG